MADLTCDRTLCLGGVNEMEYRLVGIVYHSEEASHVVTRLIRGSGTVWYCDGMNLSRTNRACNPENANVDLRKVWSVDYRATVLVYVRG